jgi:hypothetical protein
MRCALPADVEEIGSYVMATLRSTACCQYGIGCNYDSLIHTVFPHGKSRVRDVPFLREKREIGSHETSRSLHS